MANLFIGGVMTADLFAGDTLFGSAKTLIDSSITISVDSANVEAGAGNKLYAKYYHTSKFDMKFTDAMWRLDYVAKNIGGNITIGGDALVNEQVTLGDGKVGTVTKTPVAFGEHGVIGWVSLPRKDDWHKVEFTDKGFVSPIGNKGEPVCVKYFAFEDAAKKLVVSANIIPDTIHVVGRVGLFLGEENKVSSASKIGYVQFEIPRFTLSGSQEIGMTASGVGNTPLEGSAMVVESEECDGDGYYAVITEVKFDASPFDEVTALSIAGGAVDLEVGDTETLQVYAISSKALPFKVDNAKLTFTSSDTDKVVVGANTGVVEAIAETEGTMITVSITEKPEVEASVRVVVTEA